MSSLPKHHARQFALGALLSIEKGAFADDALHQVLAREVLGNQDRGFVTELVYGITRRRRTLDAIIQHFSKSKSDRTPVFVRLILRLGLYQLRYLTHIPASAAVHSSVDLAKQNGFGGLSGFVNGLLRTYARTNEPTFPLSDNLITRLGQLHSYPDWIVQIWAEQLIPENIEARCSHQLSQDHGDEPDVNDLEALCKWFNQPPSIDLRVNPLKSSTQQVQDAFESSNISTRPLVASPQGLRLNQHYGNIQSLPGYEQGWWTIQDGSAQLVSYLLDPQPDETIIDACAAPGGKTTHIAELMGDRGTVWACDRNAKRLKRLQDNVNRLQIQSVKTLTHDMRMPQSSLSMADRVLVDAPCSGLGTLHRHADARWNRSPDGMNELVVLQQEILYQASHFVKPNGLLVYATCTLHPKENEAVVGMFLEQNPQWTIDPVEEHSLLHRYHTPEGWLTVWPHHHDLDGFFMVRLKRE